MRDRKSGPFGGIQEAGVFADGETVGHAGYVVGDSAGSAVGAAGCFRGGGDGAVFGGQEVDVVEERLEQLPHHPAGFGGHPGDLVVPVEAVAEERHQLGVLLAACFAQRRKGRGLLADVVDGARLGGVDVGLGRGDQVGQDVVDHPPDDLVHQPALAQVGVFVRDNVVLPPEQANFQQLGDFDHPGADAVVDVMVVVSDFVGQVRNLGFEAGLLPMDEPFADVTELASVAYGAVLQDTFAALEREVEAREFGIAFFELVDDP